MEERTAYMELSTGLLLEGKVKSITNFGAFIVLEDGQTGLVHISEISWNYVNDIREHLIEGQSVKVKVISIDDRGKVSFSLRQAQERPRSANTYNRPKPTRTEPPKAPQTFEEKLKQFMSDSDSKISGCRQYEHKTKSRRR